MEEDSLEEEVVGPIEKYADLAGRFAHLFLTSDNNTEFMKILRAVSHAGESYQIGFASEISSKAVELEQKVMVDQRASRSDAVATGAAGGAGEGGEATKITLLKYAVQAGDAALVKLLLRMGVACNMHVVGESKTQVYLTRKDRTEELIDTVAEAVVDVIREQDKYRSREILAKKSKKRPTDSGYESVITSSGASESSGSGSATEGSVKFSDGDSVDLGLSDSAPKSPKGGDLGDNRALNRALLTSLSYAEGKGATEADVSASKAEGDADAKGVEHSRRRPSP